MKLLLLLASLYSSTSSMALAAPCTTRALDLFKTTITPDVVVGRPFVEELFRKALARELNCQMETVTFDSPDLELESCGNIMPVSRTELVISGSNQSWTLQIRKDRQSCASESLWLESLTAAHGNMLRYILLSDNIVAQVQGGGCETAADYKVISFTYRDLDGKYMRANKLLNINDEPLCAAYVPGGVTIEFPKSSLGLSDGELAQLL